jgi:hypothetical protein
MDIQLLDIFDVLAGTQIGESLGSDVRVAVED